MLYHNVDKLVANGKNSFVESPTTIELFHSNLQKHFSQIQYINIREPDWLSLLLCRELGSIFSVINKVDKYEASFVAIYGEIN